VKNTAPAFQSISSHVKHLCWTGSTFSLQTLFKVAKQKLYQKSAKC